VALRQASSNHLSRRTGIKLLEHPLTKCSYSAVDTDVIQCISIAKTLRIQRFLYSKGLLGSTISMYVSLLTYLRIRRHFSESTGNAYEGDARIFSDMRFVTSPLASMFLLICGDLRSSSVNSVLSLVSGLRCDQPCSETSLIYETKVWSRPRLFFE
jgi:hypothetical protein